MIKVTIERMTLEIPDSTGLLQAIAGNILQQQQPVVRTEEAPAYDTGQKSITREDIEKADPETTPAGAVMEELSLEILNAKSKPEVVKIAKAMGLTFTSKTIKEDLISMILSYGEENATDLVEETTSQETTSQETTSQETTSQDIEDTTSQDDTEEITLDQLRAHLTKVQESGVAIAPIITKYAKNLSSLDPKDYEAVMIDADKAML